MNDNKKQLIIKTLASFLATVLGIALTFGVSKLSDKRTMKDLQRQSVFSVLTDLENYIKYLQRDSASCASYNEWLPEYMDLYSGNEPFSVDSVYEYCFGFVSPSLFTQRSEPIGRYIIRNITPSDVHDMQLHRYIELAYDAIDRAKNIQNQIDIYTDEFNKVSALIETSNEVYDKEKVVKQYFDNEKIREFRIMLSLLSESDILGQYIKVLGDYHVRILYWAGLTEKDYDKFSKERDEKRNASQITR